MKQLRDLLRVRFSTAIEATDRKLLDRFLETRDYSAFVELGRHHGPIVRDACRRWLNDHDAEDEFQAMILVLLRQVASLPDHLTLERWLYHVAAMIYKSPFVRLRRTT
jgi:DNA-directed RNA polymerase specialized sigma24 family protein